MSKKKPFYLSDFERSCIVHCLSFYYSCYYDFVLKFGVTDSKLSKRSESVCKLIKKLSLYGTQYFDSTGSSRGF